MSKARSSRDGPARSRCSCNGGCSCCSGWSSVPGCACKQSAARSRGRVADSQKLAATSSEFGLMGNNCSVQRRRSSRQQTCCRPRSAGIPSLPLLLLALACGLLPPAWGPLRGAYAQACNSTVADCSGGELTQYGVSATAAPPPKDSIAAPYSALLGPPDYTATPLCISYAPNTTQQQQTAWSQASNDPSAATRFSSVTAGFSTPVYARQVSQPGQAVGTMGHGVCLRHGYRQSDGGYSRRGTALPCWVGGCGNGSVKALGSAQLAPPLHNMRRS
mgnify:CR=1 FL=1